MVAAPSGLVLLSACHQQCRSYTGHSTIALHLLGFSSAANALLDSALLLSHTTRSQRRRQGTMDPAVARSMSNQGNARPQADKRKATPEAALMHPKRPRGDAGPQHGAPAAAPELATVAMAAFATTAPRLRRPLSARHKQYLHFLHVMTVVSDACCCSSSAVML